ncbi:PerC family transcriptional regulator [Klebsiella pneumoniae]|uniref:PerC family transcriptional regulator n=1 Tax=Klebsiella pneumoniae TaxID=573 RepID=UPI0034CFD9E7
MIRYKKAEELKSRRLYRRAAARWADIMAKCAGDEEWKHAKRRHEACLRRSKRPEVKAR